MNIELIKKEIEEEVLKGDYTNYKKLRSFINRIYRHLNKDKVYLWNLKYRKNIKKLKNVSSSKLENKEIKKNVSSSKLDYEEIKKNVSSSKLENEEIKKNVSSSFNSFSPIMEQIEVKKEDLK